MRSLLVGEDAGTEDGSVLGGGEGLGRAAGADCDDVRAWSGVTGKTAPVLGLVGKGITFDTGGISIKPADGMEKMKYDMAGAAAMIGAMHAIARLKPAVKVIGVVCSAENMPDGKAYKPGDVVTAMSGKTIEIVNTDAEGRLVLADGLHYAKTLGCTHLIDAATLTGAAWLRWAYSTSALFSNDEATCGEIYGRLGASRARSAGGFPAPTTIATTSRARLPTS